MTALDPLKPDVPAPEAGGESLRPDGTPAPRSVWSGQPETGRATQRPSAHDQRYPAGTPPWPGPQPGVGQPGGPPGAPEPGPFVGYPPPPYYGPVPGNGYGIAALTLGILAILSSITVLGGVLLGTLAVIFGFVQRARAQQGRATSPGLGMAGISTGFAGIGLGLALIAVSIPVFFNQRDNGYDAQAKSDLRNLSTAEEAYFTDNYTYLAGYDYTLSGGLDTWTKSSTVRSVSVTAAPNRSIDQAFMAVAISGSGTSYCYDSDNSGAGVVAGSSC